MKKLFASIVAVSVFGLAAVGGTYAYFSDGEIANNNSFSAGSLNLALDLAGQCHIDGTAVPSTVGGCDGLVSLANIKPGDGYDSSGVTLLNSGKGMLWKSITVSNTGTASGHLSFKIPLNNSSKPDITYSGSCTEPEVNDPTGNDHDCTSVSTANTENIESLNELPAAVHVVMTNGTTTIFDNSLEQWFSGTTIPNMAGFAMAPGETTTLNFYYSVAPGTSNLIQDDGASFPLRFTLTQN